MANHILPQDHLLAKKYKLGVPTRKFRFDFPHSFLSHTFILFAELIIVVILGLFCFTCGSILTISATINNSLYQDWLWILAMIAIPTVTGWMMYRRGNRHLFVLNLFSAIGSQLLVFLGGYLVMIRATPPDPIAYIFGGLFLCVAGSIIIVIALNFMPLSRSIMICTDGCLFIDKLQRRRIIRWEQITSMRSDKGFVRIVCSNGSSLKLRSSWANSTTVQHIIYGKAFRYLFARARSAYHSGEPVLFGRFTVTWKGIDNGQQLFRWEQLRTCVYIDSGLALIGIDDTCLDVTYLSQLPDAAVFVELVKYILVSRQKQTSLSFDVTHRYIGTL
ncbi:DUF6585 family protein [Dictyobacter formicarum]|uniref:Uncharacterized protein n=1 Tax=Dictyobacter formicarum TaxID=2778368 RepID=A0ABQ3VSR0_9CHLR|nr:DUF6585 family protein [Dictyobacter formicarum]GHO88912.1 hypothetical protein KSZ_69180 [Dictyobacter formicarum]